MRPFDFKYFADFLEYMQIDENHFHEVIEKSRPDHLWKKDSKEWKLKKPIWSS